MRSKSLDDDVAQSAIRVDSRFVNVTHSFRELGGGVMECSLGGEFRAREGLQPGNAVSEKKGEKSALRYNLFLGCDSRPACRKLGSLSRLWGRGRRIEIDTSDWRTIRSPKTQGCVMVVIGDWLVPNHRAWRWCSRACGANASQLGGFSLSFAQKERTRGRVITKRNSCILTRVELTFRLWRRPWRG